MENHSTIEPQPDDDDDDASQNIMTAATSDYDPSIAASSFCSVSSSVNGHVWEYGRRVDIRLPRDHVLFADTVSADATRYSAMAGTRFRMTKRSSRENL
jgi:hypothetical protein